MRSIPPVVSAAAALALSATIATPALGAAPTYSGVATCFSTLTLDIADAHVFVGATKGDIAFWRKHWTLDTGFCEKGTFDTSGLTRDA